MANANTEVTLDAIHLGMVNRTKAAFPTLNVDAYSEDRKKFPVPACLFELDSMEPAGDPGTNQLGVRARWSARLVIGFKTPRAKLEIRKLAAAFAAFMRLQRWGCPIGPAMFVGAWPDDFGPELDQYECWRVEWEQDIDLGASVWTDEGITPTTPLFSFAPDIGPSHKDDYKPLEQLLAPGGQP